MRTKQMYVQTHHDLTTLGILMWLIVAIFYGLDYLQHTIPSVLIEPIAVSTGINYTSIASIMSLYFPIYAISQIPSGYLIDRYGLNRTLSIACLIVSIGLLFMVTPSIIQVLIGRVFIAIGSALAFIGALKTASIWLPKKHFSFFVGITQTIGVIGGLIGQVFINHLITSSGWQHATLNIAIFGIVWSGVLFLFLKNKTNKINHSKNCQTDIVFKKSYFVSILFDRNLQLLAVYAAIMVGVVMSTFSDLYDVIFLEKSLHISSQSATNITMFIFIGVGIGSPLHGIISNLFNKRRNWMIVSALLTFLIFMFITIATVLAVSTWILSLLYFLLGFFVSSMLLAFSFARCYYPTHCHGTIFAYINMIIGLAGFIFPLIFGKIIKVTSNFGYFSNNLTIPLLLLASMLIISIVLTFFVKEGDN